MTKNQILLFEKLIKIEKEIGKVKNKCDDEDIILLNNILQQINRLKELLETNKLKAYDGGMLGIGRAISEYDSLSAHKKLYKLAYDAEKFYSQKCIIG